MEKYNKVVSLGYNCEISFRLRNCFDKFDAQLFSWSLVTDRNKFVDVLYHPEKIFSEDMFLAPDRMFECNVTGVRFHPRHEVLDDETRNIRERTDWCKHELKQRVEYLKEKHKKLLNDGNSTLFLMKIIPTDSQEDKKYIQAIYKALKSIYRSGKFTLVIVVPKRKLTCELKNLENDNLKIRTVRWFPPQKHTDIASDSKGWFKIITEFFEVSEKEYYRREWKQRKKIIPGMIMYKIRRTVKR